MRVTVDLPDDLARKVKLRATTLGKPMKELVADLLQQGLGLPPHGMSEQMPTNSLVRIGEDGLPIVQCRPTAPAARMRVEELIRLEQETQAGGA